MFLGFVDVRPKLVLDGFLFHGDEESVAFHAAGEGLLPSAQLGKAKEKFPNLLRQMVLGDEKVFRSGDSTDEPGIAGEEKTPFLPGLFQQSGVRDLPRVRDIKARHPQPASEFTQHLVGDKAHDEASFR